MTCERRPEDGDVRQQQRDAVACGREVEPCGDAASAATCAVGLKRGIGRGVEERVDEGPCAR